MQSADVDKPISKPISIGILRFGDGAVYEVHGQKAMADDRKLPTQKSTSAEVNAFLSQMATMPKVTPVGQRGRLIFALDATASRQPTWDRAAHIQAEMFVATAALGGLELQVCFYRGYGEFRSSPWMTRSEDLLRLMTSVTCLAGQTQLRKILQHTVNETRRRKVAALVFVGDCFEEDVDVVGQIAGELGLLGVPAFMFHEGGDVEAAFAFKQVAKLSGGAYCRFDAASAQALKDLLSAVAVFAAGGQAALEDLAGRRGGTILQIAHQMKGR